MRPKNRTIQSLLVFALLSLIPLRVSAQSSNAVPRITQAVDETRLTVLPGNTYPLARPEYDRGPAPSSLPMERMMLVLRRSPEQEAALDTFLREQLDKSSPNFHKWLTPEQYGQQFGPADQDIQTVTSWLGSHGFQVAGASKGRTIIEFSGDAGQVQEAFHTPIHMFVVNGEEHWANASDPKIPTALTPVVVGVDTLHNFPRKPAYQYAGRFTREKATGKVTPVKAPEFTFGGNCFGPDTICYAVGPYDFATIYNVLPLWSSSIDGSGVIIGVSAQTDINPTDYSDFRSLFGLPYTPSTNYLNIIHNGADPGTTEDEAEGDIDSQWSGAVAKGATIDYVVSSSVDQSAEYIIDNNLSDILTESYGECELGLGTAGNQFYNSLWQQASAEGISVFIAAGDNGSAGCDNDDAEPPYAALYGLQVSGFASTPYNVAVGGTDFNDGANELTYWSPNNNSMQASALGYIPEVIWNNSCANPVFATLGYSTDPVTNCNNPGLKKAVLTVGGSGGPSSCTISDGPNPSNCTVGSGYPKPTWQAGPGVPIDGVRDIPDVSLFSGNGFQGNFYIVCQIDGNVPASSSCNLNSPFTDFAGFGGTSVATPAMAGIMAMVVQKSGSRQGNPNPFLYNLAAESGASCNSASPSGSCIFYDLAAGAGTNAMPCAKASPNCSVASGDTYGVLPGFATTAGYDQASGLGSVNAANLVNSSWPVSHTADYNVSFSPTLLTIAALGDSGTVTLTVNPLNGYAGAVSFASAKCTNLPANTTCTFASLSSTTATITVQTTKTANVFPHSRPASFGNWAVSDGIVRTVVLSFGLLFLGFQAKRRQWSRVAGFLVAAFLIATVACGGGGGGGSTPPPPPPVVSNQPIVVTVTDGATIHSATFLLTID